MTNDKINFSLRINPYIHKMVNDEAKKLGISKNSLITMILNQHFKNENDKER